MDGNSAESELLLGQVEAYVYEVICKSLYRHSKWAQSANDLLMKECSFRKMHAQNLKNALLE